MRTVPMRLDILMLQQDGRVAAAFEILAREYDVAPERLSSDLVALIRDLEAADLVVIEG